MNAYLTFFRKNEKDFHMIGIENPINSKDLNYFEINSGQPVICILDNNKLIGLYCIYESGELNQIYGESDYLFNIKTIIDLTSINLLKYNTIKYNLISMFSCLSLYEFPIYKNDLDILENKIFYNLLHTELDIFKLKNYLKKEIKKSSLKYEIKQRFYIQLNNIKKISNKNLRKKIDLNLYGYNIYIKNQINFD